MSSKDATFHSAQDLIYVIQNPSPARPLVKLGNGHKDSLMNLSEIFRKASAPAVLPRMLVREVAQEKLKEVNQERAQTKSASQSKPLTNEEPPRVPIV